MKYIKLYESQKHTLYEIEKELGLGLDILYRYARGERKIENMPTKTILAIAYYEHIEPNELYRQMKKYLSYTTDEVEDSKNK